MATSSVNFISALGTGSGVDVKALAQNLVDAEKGPRAELIQRRIDKNETRISGYRTVVYGVEQLQKAIEALKSPSAFRTVTTQSSQPEAVAISVTGTPGPLEAQVGVTRLAQGQRSVSGEVANGRGFSSASQPLNGNPPVGFNLSITIGTEPARPISVTTPTPQGVVDAINRAGLSVTATLVNRGGSPADYRIVLNGATGDENAFDISADATAVPLGFAAGRGTGPLDRIALNSQFSVDGLTIERRGNQVSDVIEGVTLDLRTTTTAGTPATVSLSRDTASVKDKIKAIVTAYNDLQSILDAGFDPESDVEGLGGSLVGDVTARRIRDQVRRVVMPDTVNAGNPQALTSLRSLGLFVDTDGRMKFATLKDGNPATEELLQVGDEGRLDELLESRFGEVTELFSAVNGLGKDLADQLSGSGRYVDSLASPSSPRRILLAGTAGATQRIDDDKERLTALEDRMKGLLERYIRQFAVMDSLVGEAKSTRTGIENSFKGMSYSRS